MIFDVAEARIRSSGKEPERVKTKRVAAYWPVRELGIAGTEAGKEWGLGKSRDFSNIVTPQFFKI